MVVVTTVIVPPLLPGLFAMAGLKGDPRRSECGPDGFPLPQGADADEDEEATRL